VEVSSALRIHGAPIESMRRRAVMFALLMGATMGLPLADTPGADTGGTPLPIPMGQEGSGTAWVPASAPMHGHQLDRGSWRVMLHYSAFAGVARQGSRQRATEGVTANWFMAMGRHDLAGGALILRSMLSLEPLALKREGYPLLLQTGEAARSEPLVDRQHPHDLFMEIGLKYDRPLTSRWGLEVYLAPAGEPALGPVAFPHRPSAAMDPLAPLGHHWLDSTHISFGVLTIGAHTRRVKVEGSWFNAREPDEYRTDFDLQRPDSYAGRITVNPTDDWNLQASYGHLKEPELLEPGEDVRRVTASAMYNRRLTRGNWATTFAWGRNEPEGGPASNALLLETAFTAGPNAVFGRAEYVQKTGHDFGLDSGFEDDRLPVGGLSVGYSRQVSRSPRAVVAIGGRAFVGRVDELLEQHRYGTATPLGGMVFVQVRPGGMHDHH
jgi:hypothetical protein